MDWGQNSILLLALRKGGEVGMTNQEAIDILEEVKYNDDSMYAYNNAYCEALDMAIEALKVQTSRVMTLEEVKQWCKTHPHKQNPIWVEFQHGYGTDGWRFGLVNSGILAWCKDNEARCWTSRPDRATMEVTPWG